MARASNPLTTFRRSDLKLALVLLAVGVTTARPARAEVPGEESARRTFERGVALEKMGDYAAALTKFRESMAIKTTLGNRFHIAFCLEMTGRLATALDEYEFVEKAARDQNKAEIVEAVRVRLEPLRPRVPQLALKITQPLPQDGEVLLDGSVVAPGLLDGQSFRVDPGEHTVSAHAPNHEAFTRRLSVVESSNTTVDVVLRPSTPTSTAGPGASTPTKVEATPLAVRARWTHTAPILTTAGAVVLAAGGVAAFALAGDAQGEAERTCPTRVTCSAEREKVRALDGIALAGFLGAASLGALSIVLWITGPRSPAGGSAPSTAVVFRPSWLGLERHFF